MATHLAPYIHFPRNDAAEAFAFYGQVFGCEPSIQRAGDQPMPGMDQLDPQRVIHAQIQSPDGVNLYGSDDCMDQKITPQGFETCIMTDDTEMAEAWFDALAEGGHVDMPYAAQPWGDSYGQVTDRFGIRWAVNCAGPQHR
ncbi:VOC family protein [Mariniluteicoccus endophyticus]